MNQQKSIVFLGFSDFPFGFAEAQRMILISKALILNGNTVTVICRNGTREELENSQLKNNGTYENIQYQYMSGSCFRHKRFFRRRLLEIKGRINEVLFLRDRKREQKIDFAILSTRSITTVAFYCALAWIFKFKTILNYVEFYTASEKSRFQIFKRINDILFDKYAAGFSDGVFPISQFLINHFKKNYPSKPYLKIPILTDIDRYTDIQTVQKEKYFLFCGSAGYKQIICFVIDAFELLSDSAYYLFLVINGSEGEMQEIGSFIKFKRKKERIKVLTRLSERDLFTYYKNAVSLLIPLRPTLQDIARFPHKTGEYLASGNPVISTKYGEVKSYFTDLENMLLAEFYEERLFAEKMQFIIDHPIESKKIGANGKELSTKLFNYDKVADELNDFLDKL